MVKVKICGITNWPDASDAIKAGVNFLGFNFYPKSPRCISPALARRIVKRLPEHVAAVGVFVNAAKDEMLSIASTVGLDYLQLHGEELPELVMELDQAIPVIKALRVHQAFRVSELSRFKQASAFLLDGFDRRARGGTGKTIDWTLARRAGRTRRIFLAGGITPENAALAVSVAKPYAIDVCSGVERSKGKKDAERMRALLHAVRSTGRKIKP
ncbi:MAG: phosphoribosylanthranilate isomerase [Candidatus Acidiferrales bacterium]